MEQHTELQEVTYHHEPASDTRRIWKTFWLLLIITIIELLLGLVMYAFDLPGWAELFIKGVVVIATILKAFYIVSIFMHLGDEIKNLIMTIVMPLLLFVWFIAAFLWDGNEYRASRNKYDKHFQERTVTEELRTGDTTSTPGGLK